VVAKVIDALHTSGIASVGLLTPDLEKASNSSKMPLAGGREYPGAGPGILGHAHSRDGCFDDSCIFGSNGSAGFGLRGALALAAGLSGCNKLKARDLLNKGVAAYKNGQYDTAIEDFKQAKELILV